MDEFRARAVGYVRSGLRNRDQAPRQGRDAGVESVIEILPGFEEGVKGLREGSRIQVLCWMHLARRDIMSVHPKGDPSRPLTGVFNTRSPARPNPISVYTVELVSLTGTKLQVRGMDAVDGTPVLDIKPHIRRLDD